MKRLLPLLALVLSLGILLPPLQAAEPASNAGSRQAVPSSDRSPASSIATSISTVTGIAISPLLGTGAYGAYQYFAADTPERKAALPWYAKVTFWLPALALVGVCACKDSLGAVVPPGLKKPLDVLETVENKASALVAAGAVVPLTMDTLSKLVTTHAQAHGAASGLAMMTLGTLDLHWFLNVLTIPFGIAMFAIVWMASHAINVLILLSPWGAIDAALKGTRTALLGLLTLTATINPWVGAALSLVVILVAYLVAGWAFRLTVFGSVFCWDFFTHRKGRFSPAKTGGNRLFSGALLTKLKVPVRTYGDLSMDADGKAWTFSYRPWLIGAVRTVRVEPESSEVAKGMFFSTLRDKEGTLFLLPPRYRDHEEELLSIYAIQGGVRPAGLLKAWGALKELFSGSAARQQVA
jgi:hypothetical protein